MGLGLSGISPLRPGAEVTGLNAEEEAVQCRSGSRLDLSQLETIIGSPDAEQKLTTHGGIASRS